MADPRGFLKVKRKKPVERPVAERVKDSREFVVEPDAEEIRAQASRCMDCGIPFCHQGCPLGNLIPEFNDLLYKGKLEHAARVLSSTNNFPEITGRVCPAPCEASCVLSLEEAPVTIKDVERTIARRILSPGSPPPPPMARRALTHARVAVVGSGPAGMAAAQELARAGHDVTLFERDDRIGGLLRYGIPDFKLEKELLDLRLTQMVAEGVTLQTGVNVGVDVTAKDLRASFDAVLLCLGARAPRDLPVVGRDLAGIEFAMDFLVTENRRVAGLDVAGGSARATGQRVVVLGGGDTGSDCVGTANRHGAASVVQLELMPKPPLVRMPDNPWPAWPLVYRTSSSQEEGCDRDFAVMTRGFVAAAGTNRVSGLTAVRCERRGERLIEDPSSEFTIPCDRVLLAMGFTGPEASPLFAELGLTRDGRGNVVSDAAGATNVPGVFAAGDASRGQSLVVWAIADGRRVAAGIDAWLRRDGRAHLRDG